MTKKRLILVLAMFVMIGAVLTGCNTQEKKQETIDLQVQKIPVAVESVQLGTLEKTIPLGGLLKAQEEVFVVAKSPVFKIVDVLVEVGDYVTEG
ncbi:MAG: hypothetical protein PHX01_05010, partial [Clostridia bacterium]|nr:hypothetical protein [Clostridia bacterium]